MQVLSDPSNSLFDLNLNISHLQLPTGFYRIDNRAAFIVSPACLPACYRRNLRHNMRRKDTKGVVTYARIPVAIDIPITKYLSVIKQLEYFFYSPRLTNNFSKQEQAQTSTDVQAEQLIWISRIQSDRNIIALVVFSTC